MIRILGFDRDTHQANTTEGCIHAPVPRLPPLKLDTGLPLAVDPSRSKYTKQKGTRQRGTEWSPFSSAFSLSLPWVRTTKLIEGDKCKPPDRTRTCWLRMSGHAPIGKPHLQNPATVRLLHQRTTPVGTAGAVDSKKMAATPGKPCRGRPAAQFQVRGLVRPQVLRRGGRPAAWSAIRPAISGRS